MDYFSPSKQSLPFLGMFPKYCVSNEQEVSNEKRSLQSLKLNDINMDSFSLETLAKTPNGHAVNRINLSSRTSVSFIGFLMTL